MELSKSEHGEVKIHNEVIITIARRAAMEVDGVEKIATGFRKGLLSFLGHKKFSRGVTLERNREGEIKVTLSVVVKYGVRIPELVNRVQINVKKLLEQIAGITPREVNVEVERVAPEEGVSHLIREITSQKKGKGGVNDEI